MNQSTQTEKQLVQPRDSFVDMYNQLWLLVRENKNTLTRWMDNLFTKCEATEKKLNRLDTFFTIENNVRCDDIDVLDKQVEALESYVEELENKMEEMKVEMREELLMEMREEMRS